MSSLLKLLISANILKICKNSMYLSKIYIIKSIGNYAGKLLTEIISKELFYVHNRGIVFAREPKEEAKCLDCCTAVSFRYKEEEVTKLSLCKFVPTSRHDDVDCLHKKVVTLPRKLVQTNGWELAHTRNECSLICATRR